MLLHRHSEVQAQAAPSSRTSNRLSQVPATTQKQAQVTPRDHRFTCPSHLTCTFARSLRWTSTLVKNATRCSTIERISSTFNRKSERQWTSCCFRMTEARIAAAAAATGAAAPMKTTMTITTMSTTTRMSHRCHPMMCTRDFPSSERTMTSTTKMRTATPPPPPATMMPTMPMTFTSKNARTRRRCTACAAANLAFHPSWTIARE
mmetsp:Transcript_5188/g.13968  ORF Transcript_5188/g.13968 Transcript_5188/m.13968 type:complete len:205 (-) Transcript_5188:471-1085(-)